MQNDSALREEIKTLLIENLMLQVGAEEIGDDQPLFGPGSLGLDSVDALQLVVVLDKNYGLKVPDPDAAREILQSVRSIADALAKNSAKPSAQEAAIPQSGEGATDHGKAADS